MTIETPTAVEAGWYPDPSGVPQMRWWSGAGWTDHIAPHAQTMETVSNTTPALDLVQPAAPALPPLDENAGAPLRFDPTITISKPRRVPWAPIVFGALGVVVAAVIVLVLVTVLKPATAAPATTGGTSSLLGPSGPHVYPENPALSTVQAQEASLVGALEDANGGGTSLAAGDSWPTSLNVTSSNKIITPDGTYLGMLPSGDSFTYSTDDNGNFTLQMHGANANEISVYSSATNQYMATCPASDTTCSPA